MDAEIKQEFIGAGIDVDDALHRFMERDDLFVRFMKDYLEDDNLEKMKSSLAYGNVGDAFNYAHTLKGVAGNLSMKGMLKDLVPVVEILRIGSTEGIDDYIKAISDDNVKILDVINKL